MPTPLEAANTLYDLQTNWLKACNNGQGSPGLREAAEKLFLSLDPLFIEAGKDEFYRQREEN